MQEKTIEMLRAAEKLYCLGVALEAARQRLKKMVEAGVSYQSDQMAAALQSYQSMEAEWKQLEQQYLEKRGNP